MIRPRPMFILAGGVIVAAAFAAVSPSSDPSSFPSILPSILPTASPTESVLPSASPVAAKSNRLVLQAVLQAANGSGVNGTATIVVDAGRGGIFINANGLSPGAEHQQHLHVGTTCPGLEADTNGDGFVDVTESEAVSGKPGVSFTLNSVRPGEAGRDRYPVASANGVLNYVNDAPIGEWFAGLRLGDGAPSIIPTATPSPVGDYGLDAAAAFNALAGRAIELHGIDAGVQLPSTVKSEQGLPSNQTLPVACGILTELPE